MISIFKFCKEDNLSNNLYFDIKNIFIETKLYFEEYCHIDDFILFDKTINFYAVLNNKIVGATCNKFLHHSKLYQDPFFKDKNMVYEFDIAIIPKYQGGTIGYLLMKKCIEEAEELNKGIDTIMVNHIINQQAAKMLKLFFNFKFFKTKINPLYEVSMYKQLEKHLTQI